ncbi:MAG: hypothetical protein WCG25_05615 [bacterium]
MIFSSVVSGASDNDCSISAHVFHVITSFFGVVVSSWGFAPGLRILFIIIV